MFSDIKNKKTAVIKKGKEKERRKNIPRNDEFR